jgi:hypothetical protein
MGPCPPPQHQPPGGAYALDIHCISMYMSCIYMIYTRICFVYVNIAVYTMYILCIYMI